MKAKILKAVKDAQAIGLKIWPGSFGCISNNRCCPMTAVALTKASPGALSGGADRFNEELVIVECLSELGVVREWVLGFIQGYDTLKNEAKNPASTYKSGFRLGRELRRDYSLFE